MGWFRKMTQIDGSQLDLFRLPQEQKFSLPLRLRQHITLAMVKVNAGYLHPLLWVHGTRKASKGHRKPSFWGVDRRTTLKYEDLFLCEMTCWGSVLDPSTCYASRYPWSMQVHSDNVEVFQSHGGYHSHPPFLDGIFLYKPAPIILWGFSMKPTNWGSWAWK